MRGDGLSNYVPEPNTGCWLWLGSVNNKGYPRLTGDRLAHRVMYERENGVIPAGLELDHLCFVPSCVNPAHLEPVTHAVNLQRARSANAEKTHCQSGHAFTRENTILRAGGRGRDCRACHNAAVERYHQKKRSLA